MTTITNTTTTTTALPRPRARIVASSQPSDHQTCQRRTALIATVATATLGPTRAGLAAVERWGTRSFIKERYFMPGLSPEDAVARIKQTRDGLYSIRDMLENMAWRYVLFYIRLKTSYLSQDLKNAINTLPDSKVTDYVKAANELVDNMTELDRYVRSPKVYESYLYYEKTLKSIDNVVAILA